MSPQRKAQPRLKKASPADGHPREPRATRLFVLGRWRDRSGGANTDDVPLLAGYRRPPIGRSRRVALYLALAIIAVAWGFAFGLSAPFRVMPLIAPLPVFILLIIWALPEGDYAPAKAIEPLFVAFLAALMLWPNYIAVVLPGLPWLTMLRIFAAPLLVVALICVSVSARFRTTMKLSIGSDPVIWRVLAVFVFLQTFSLFLSERPVFSINRYIVDQLNHTVIFLISCYVFLMSGFAKRWSLALLAMGFIICAIGLWEGSIGTLPWVGHIPPFLKVEGGYLEGAMRSSVGIHRVQAMSAHPIGMAEILGLVAPIALHIGMTRNPLLLRIAAFAYIPLAAVLIELADSRLGNVALLAALVFYMLLWAALRWRQNRQSILAPAIVLLYPALMAAGLVATFFVGRLRNAVWGSGAKQGSSLAREMQWEMATPKIISHPLGHGLGQAARKVGYINPAGQGSLDSYYINILMDFGPMGFVLFFGMFLYAAWLAARVVIDYQPKGDMSLLLPFMVCMLQFVIIKSVLGLDHNHPLVFMMLGGIVALSFRAKREGQLSPPAPKAQSLLR